MMQKAILILIIFSLFASFAAALDESDSELPFSVTIDIIKDRIDFEESARFKITIENTGDKIERFAIRSGAPHVEWFIKTDPISDYSVKVYPNSKKEIFIVAKPITVGLGRHALKISIKNEKFKTDIIKNVEVNIISMSNLPSVSISGKVPKIIDPRKQFIITVWLENRNSKDLADVQVQLRSDAIHKSTNTSLGPIDSGTDKKTLEFSVNLNKKTAPIKDSLRIYVIVNEGDETYELKSASFNYEIITYGEIIERHNKSIWLLGSEDIVTFENSANGNFVGVARVENTFIKALFTRVNPKGKSFVSDGKRYIGWDINLGPYENFSAKISVNFLPLIIVIIVVASLIFFYFRFRSSIIMVKSVSDIVLKEGGIKQFKVLLQIKNRSNNIIENISIVDRIPDIAEYEQGSEIGTLHPTKIVHTKRGVIAKWVINSLDKDEETVIKYAVNSRLSILGRLPLPVASSKFNDKSGKIKRSYSNSTVIG